MDSQDYRYRTAGQSLQVGAIFNFASRTICNFIKGVSGTPFRFLWKCELSSWVLT